MRGEFVVTVGECSRHGKNRDKNYIFGTDWEPCEA